MPSALYDRIGAGYDGTRRADPELVRRHVSHLCLSASSDTIRYLDLACGTGNYSVALAAVGGDWTAVDQSRRMLMGAAAKNAPVRWLRADAAALPCGDGVFAGAICTLAIHHFESVEPVFVEARRVVTPGGRLVLLTSTREQMEGFWLNHYFPGTMARTIRRRLPREEIHRCLEQGGWRVVVEDPYEVAPDLEDGFTYSGKHRPEIYLDPRIRVGMSTFSAMAVEGEVEAGCAQLEQDLASGEHRRVRERYAHPLGDYLFVVVE